LTIHGKSSSLARLDAHQSLFRERNNFGSGLSVKDFFHDRTLVDEADDVHFARALGADKKICFVHLGITVRLEEIMDGAAVANLSKHRKSDTGLQAFPIQQP